MSDQTKEDLLLFFDRPIEPCFMLKGDNVIFKLPESYYPDKLKAVVNNLDKFARRFITVREITLPDLSLPMQLDLYDRFSFFVPKHMKMAVKLTEIFLNMDNVVDLLSICAYCQLRINPYMFNYCLSVALLHREDTKRLNLPSYVESFPDKFFDPTVFRGAREETTILPPKDRYPIVLPPNFTAAEWDTEQRVAYFREDIGINLHHWHWHLVYPSSAPTRAIVAKDRRGELFYYMHQQIIARYATERLCNDLERVKRFNDFHGTIEEAYFPKLESQVASRAWPPRYADTYISDLDRPGDEVNKTIHDLDLYRNRFITAIENMSIILPHGKTMPLDEETGIDVLGNIMEASILSPNPGYYGNMHNLGHLFIGYAHDPDNRYLEKYAVMGDSATAMRDPVFYRWHAYVDDLFQNYKYKLPQYPKEKLNFPGIRVSSIGIESPKGVNVFTTHWQQSTVQLDWGLDFSPRGPVFASFTHLQHDDYNYVISVNNKTGTNVKGTVRIFVAPMRNEKGKLLTFDEQRRLMIELDKFTEELPAGTKTICRRSVDSSVTIPYGRIFRPQNNRPGDPGSPEAAQFDFCGCGWPHHMLIPKGTEKGYPVILFCMISNWDDDRVDQDLTGTCNDAASYCGLRDRKYPDRRSMGYPFDRPAQASKLANFLTPNMAIQKCKILFTNETKQHKQQEA